MSSDTIVALATPWGRSAIAVIRVSGAHCLEIVHNIFNCSKDLRKAVGHTIHYGTIVNNDVIVDQVIVLVFKAPKSYTGEHMVEICCHGNPIIIKKIITILLANGCVDALAGEFTQRALLNGKLDLTAVEALPQLINANTYHAYDNAMQHMNGQLYRNISTIKKQLVKILGAINIQLDYPTEESGTIHIDSTELSSIQQQLSTIISSYAVGKLFTDGMKVMIFGRPNAGKSTLFNLMLGQERAITSDTAGTTRDYLQHTVEIAGIPIEIYDTAGLRQQHGSIEAQGIAKCLELSKEAHIILYVIDKQCGISDIDISYINTLATNLQHTQHSVAHRTPVIVINKTDLCESLKNIEYLSPSLTTLYISAKDGSGLSDLTDTLERLISTFVKIDNVEYQTSPIITSQRQKTLLTKAMTAITSCTTQLQKQYENNQSLDILTIDIEEAIGWLGEITGEVTKDDILDVMFSNYCVGK